MAEADDDEADDACGSSKVREGALDGVEDGSNTQRREGRAHREKDAPATEIVRRSS